MSRKEEKVLQIIDSATEEFLAKGFDAASMHNISKQALVSKRTLYKYYPTKEDLYSALIDEILDLIEGMYSFSYDPKVSIELQIEKIITMKMNLTLTDSFLKISKIVIGGMLKSRRPTLAQLERMNKSEYLFIEWIKRAQKDNRISIKFEAIEIASQFHSILKGQIYWPILMGLQDKSTLDIDKVKKTTMDFFLRSFCN